MLIVINIKIPLLLFKEIKTNNGVLNSGNNNFEKQNIFCVLEIFFEIILFWLSFSFNKNCNFNLRKLFDEYFEINDENNYSEDLLEGLNGFHISYLNQKLIYISENIKCSFSYFFNFIKNENNEIKENKENKNI